MIPIANVYYLLLYAWRHTQWKAPINRGATQGNTLPDLLGHVLAEATAGLLGRGLAREYVEQRAEVPGIKGKLELARTVKSCSLIKAQTHCSFDELDHDVPRNRIIKTTIRNLLSCQPLDPEIRARLRRVHSKMDTVSEIPLSQRLFTSVTEHRNVQSYSFVLRVCQLIHQSLLVQPGKGTRFLDFREDDARMGTLFEDFVHNFYRVKLPHAAVAKPHIRWFGAIGSNSSLALLPVMRTDLVIEDPSLALVIETKFVQSALQGRFSKDKLTAGHLYQLFAYLENRGAAHPGKPQRGLLLYAMAGSHIAASFELKGHSVDVRTIDLSQPWEGVEADMLKLAAPFTRQGELPARGV
jgi:5-methylcytosine-specific restriction enzyme subunit McrC